MYGIDKEKELLLLIPYLLNIVCLSLKLLALSIEIEALF